ncbi:hypothetical protein T12_12376 [Trichinella patagoniensis]|uniref:Uncharacterized protein n=1 Tax=Trichinella patagoniensis TaxID=990121 RepID=A0A0V1A0S0_9BILA|nr:hypothetical protein T12_12376 [Trichinella patagoniensis]
MQHVDVRIEEYNNDDDDDDDGTESELEKDEMQVYDRYSTSVAPQAGVQGFLTPNCNRQPVLSQRTIRRFSLQKGRQFTRLIYGLCSHRLANE